MGAIRDLKRANAVPQYTAFPLADQIGRIIETTDYDDKVQIRQIGPSFEG